jgi:hypothetical protein
LGATELNLVTKNTCCIAEEKMLLCNSGIVGGAKMATARFLRRQAASCAALARQTHDEDSRQRCLTLEQTFLQLAGTEEQLAAHVSADTDQRDDKRTV